MFGHVSKAKRPITKDGKRTGATRVRWRARYPDPDGVKPTDQVERVFNSKAEANEWLREESAKIRRGHHSSARLGKRTFATIAEEWEGPLMRGVAVVV
jgi:hypothetical protein